MKYTSLEYSFKNLRLLPAQLRFGSCSPDYVGAAAQASWGNARALTPMSRGPASISLLQVS